MILKLKNPTDSHENFMSDDKNLAAKEKLAFLAGEIERVAIKIGHLITTHEDPDDLKALAKLNDRAALYLQDIALLISDERELDIPTMLDFIDLVEHYVDQIDSI